MSELITNLQTIYNTKLAIKQAIGTDSDNFVDYPSYISGMVTPTGTYNISENGNYDISTYASTYVNVPQGITPTGYSYITVNGDYDISTYAMVNVNVSGGGVEYTWIDWSTSPVLTQGDKVSFNGYLGNAQQITQEIISVYPGFADYLGWYLYPVGGWDHTTTGTTPWEKYVLSENQLSISQNSGVVVYGEIVDITMGSATQKITILEDINLTKYAGGNGTKNITSNGTEQVVGYQSVSVNVTPQSNHDGLTETTAFTVDEAIAFINTLDENVPTSNMYYVKGRISQVIYTFSAQYSTWRGYISDDGVMYNDQTASDNVDHTKELFIYNNGYDVNYQTVNWNVGLNPQVKVGDSVVVYANFQLWTDTKISRKPQTNNGYLANHQRAVNGTPVSAITTNGVVDIQDYVSVTVNVQSGPVNITINSGLFGNDNSDNRNVIYDLNNSYTEYTIADDLQYNFGTILNNVVLKPLYNIDSTYITGDQVYKVISSEYYGNTSDVSTGSIGVTTVTSGTTDYGIGLSSHVGKIKGSDSNYYIVSKYNRDEKDLQKNTTWEYTYIDNFKGSGNPGCFVFTQQL